LDFFISGVKKALQIQDLQRFFVKYGSGCWGRTCLGIEKESPTGRQTEKHTSISDRLVELPRVSGFAGYEWQEAA